MIAPACAMIVLTTGVLYGLDALLIAAFVVALVAASTWARRRGGLPPAAGYGLMAAETALVTTALFAGDPLGGFALPAPLIFVTPAVLALFFLMVVQSTGAGPWAAAWSGALALVAWAVARVYTLAAPGTLSRADIDPSRHDSLKSYLAAISVPHYFSGNVWLLQMVALAGVAVVLILSAYRARALAREASAGQAVRARLAAHFAAPVVQALLDAPDEPAGEAEATVLDCDLTGFSAAVAGLPADATARLLRTYYGLVEQEVFAHGGAVLKFTGDGVTAVFGLTAPGPDNAGRALACAERLVALWSERAGEVAGERPLGIAVGLDHGVLRWGIVGGDRSSSLLVLGEAVEEAQRLQSETRRAQVPILASATVLRLAGRSGRGAADD